MIIAEKELEYMEHIQSVSGLSTSGSDANPPPGLLKNTEEPFMFDLRSPDTSGRESTPNQHRYVRRSHPDDDGVVWMGFKEPGFT